MALEPEADGKSCLLHVFATFDAGGPQVRTLEVMRTASPLWRHLIVAADGRTGAASLLTHRHNAEVYALPRAASTAASVRRILAIARREHAAAALTYNWGGMDGVFAALFGRIPYVHHEETVPPEERGAALLRRNLVRRFALARAATVVVPSSTMHARAQRLWQVPASKLLLIPNGVDSVVRSGARAGAGDGWLRIGCVAHLRPEKNVPRLIRAFARIRRSDARLCVVGDGPMRADCQAAAARHGVADRVDFVGHVDDTSSWYRRFDVLALSSDDEQMPLTILEGMAHGLPIVATDVGDVRRMLPMPQRSFVVPLHEEADALMAGALAELLESADLRRRLGRANRAHAVAHHSLDDCVRRYEQVWRTACGLAHRNRRHGAG